MSDALKNRRPEWILSHAALVGFCTGSLWFQLEGSVFFRGPAWEAISVGLETATPFVLLLIAFVEVAAWHGRLRYRRTRKALRLAERAAIFGSCLVGEALAAQLFAPLSGL